MGHWFSRWDLQAIKLHLTNTICFWVQDNIEGTDGIIHTATATINIIIEQADTRPPWFLPCTFIDTERSICISSTYTGRVNMSEMSVRRHDKMVSLMLLASNHCHELVLISRHKRSLHHPGK